MRFWFWIPVLAALVTMTSPAFTDDYEDDLLRSRPAARAHVAVAPKGNADAMQELKLDTKELALLQTNLVDSPALGAGYRIGPFDLLKIDVLHAEEFSQDERVNAEGEISLPLIGSVKVSGLTAVEAERQLSKKLSEQYFQDPQVNVYVKEFNSQRITVYGYVKKPGVYALKGQTTLMEAIAIGGGLDDMANEKDILVLRQNAQGTLTGFVVDLHKIQEGENKDPVIYANDRVVVPKSGAKAFRKGVGEALRNVYMLWPFIL